VCFGLQGGLIRAFSEYFLLPCFMRNSASEAGEVGGCVRQALPPLKWNAVEGPFVQQGAEELRVHSLAPLLQAIVLVLIVGALEHQGFDMEVLRWSPFPGQICGFAKLGSGPCHAANLIPTGAPWWASAGVRPPSAECGRSAL